MVGPLGLEPRTSSLKGSCSTIELRTHGSEYKTDANNLANPVRELARGIRPRRARTGKLHPAAAGRSGAFSNGVN
ncbi:MAG: hypothetical protein UX68_C0032G0013 [Parcubacteria group bacterium GW2011_GWA2_46_9]|nr:MAG: hypothetical protein UX68_C0032G0013 [Parcubacteria group bacterium GW2011_GWA2_46_9]